MKPMKPMKVAILQIVNALFFAVLMILISWWTRGNENWLFLQQALIAIWWIPFSFLLAAGQREGCC